MLLVKPMLRSAILYQPCFALHPLSRQVSFSDGNNVCAVKLHNCSPQATIVVVYRSPNATDGNTVAKFQELGSFYLHLEVMYKKLYVIMVGNFNIVRDWTVPVVPCLVGAEGKLSNLIIDFDLMQLNNQPSQRLNILDLVLISQYFSKAVVC